MARRRRAAVSSDHGRGPLPIQQRSLIARNAWPELLRPRANLARLLSTIEFRASSTRLRTLTNRSRLPIQTSNRSCRCEKDSWRRSPSVPRGAPQCRHLIGVEGGAFSGQSNTMPNASQLMQTILNSGLGTGARSSCDAFMLVILSPKSKAAKRSMIARRLRTITRTKRQCPCVHHMFSAWHRNETRSLS
jgi:hypothetical protein